MLDDTQEIVGKEHILTNEKVSPYPPTTIPVNNNEEAFGIACHNIVEHMEIKLSIEFPLKNGYRVNDVVLYFKGFITVLFTADKDILLLTWEKSPQHLISKAIDIIYEEEMISEYYLGRKMRPDRERIIGFTRISSPAQFNHIKKQSYFLNWLQNNEV